MRGSSERLPWAESAAGTNLLVVAGFAVAALVVFALGFARPSPFGDGDIFPQGVALSHLIRGGGDLAAFQVSDQIFPVVFYAAAFTVMPFDATPTELWMAAVVWNHLWVLAALFLIKGAAKSLGVASHGLWAAVPFLVYPLAFYYSYAVHAEIPGFVAATVIAWSWLSICGPPEESGRGGAAALFVLASIALVLTRPGVALAPLLALIPALRLGGSQLPGGAMRLLQGRRRRSRL